MSLRRISNVDLGDMRRDAQLRGERGRFSAPSVQGFGANLGTTLAAAIAAAGITPCDVASRIACETDYLAISGETFPADVTLSELEAFNRATLKAHMSEADEFARYAAIAKFWHRRRA